MQYTLMLQKKIKTVLTSCHSDQCLCDNRLQFINVNINGSQQELRGTWDYCGLFFTSAVPRCAKQASVLKITSVLTDIDEK